MRMNVDKFELKWSIWKKRLGNWNW